MISDREILLGMVLPLVLAGVAGAVAAWKRWAWLLPLAAGGAFVVGYWQLIDGRKWPPIAGSDWLLWTSGGAAVVGVVAALVRPRWAAPALGPAAGVVVYVIGRPLSPHAVSPQVLWTTSLLVALGAAGVVGALTWAGSRVPAGWVAGAMVVAVGGAAVLSMSSGFRTMGVYGIGAAAALAPAAAAALRFRMSDVQSSRTVRGLAVYAVAVLAGVLAAGKFYPEPGISWTQFALVMLVPAVVAPAALVPGRRPWVRGVIALAAVAALVASVVGPAALKAKRAAENPDPYSDYYYTP